MVAFGMHTKDADYGNFRRPTGPFGRRSLNKILRETGNALGN
jgi:hypothetical protein